MNIETKDDEEKQKLGPEKIFFEGPPSKVELIIPFFSILTVRIRTKLSKKLKI